MALFPCQGSRCVNFLSIILRRVFGSRLQAKWSRLQPFIWWMQGNIFLGRIGASKKKELSINTHIDIGHIPSNIIVSVQHSPTHCDTLSRAPGWSAEPASDRPHHQHLERPLGGRRGQRAPVQDLLRARRRRSGGDGRCRWRAKHTKL